METGARLLVRGIPRRYRVLLSRHRSLLPDMLPDVLPGLPNEA